jgi:hypothetical protein
VLYLLFFVSLIGPRNFNAKVDKRGESSSIIRDENEIEEVVGVGDSHEEENDVLILEDEEDELSDIDIGDDS